MKEKKTITHFSSPLTYEGNLFFLILFLILWLPVGLLMLMRHGRIVKRESKFSLHYCGSWGWLLFWGLFFFPISILLLLMKGVEVIEELTMRDESIVDPLS